MNTAVQKLLLDLYEIDPTLSAHEAQLLPLLEMLIEKDPSLAPDSAFVARLRSQLASTPRAPALSLWKKLSYALGGAVTAAVIIPLAIIATNQLPLSTNAPLFSNSVEATGRSAFGSLRDIASVSENAAISARPMSGGGGGGMPIMAEDTSVSAVAPANAMVDSKMMIAPWPMVQYQYVYSGSLTDLTPEVTVYKKNTKPLAVPMSVIGDQLAIGGLNMSSFDDMQIDSVSFTQRREFGYQMSVNLRDASVSIDANWEQWPQSTCQTEACYQAERVKIDDVPADDVIIDIAQTFAAEHGIDLSDYGAPEVDNAWRRDYDRTVDKTMAYVPDIQRVIFPQIIDNKPVYDQSGVKSGLSISVNVKHRKVMSVWGMGDHSYITSQYAGVTDAAAVQKFLSTVDNYYYGETPNTAKTAKVVLGTPIVSYAMYYRYTSGKNEELLIPALIFPVDHTEGDTENTFFYRTQIVVPLAQDMLDEQSSRPPVMPMMMKDGVGVEAEQVPAPVPVSEPAVR